MTKEELIHKINDLEWEDFEAKEAKSELPKNIWETVSAFANTSGGWIVLGIKQIGKKFEVCGVDNIEKLEQDFLGTLRGQKFNIKLSASAYKNVGFGIGKLFSWKEITGNDVTFDSDRNIVRICFHLQNNLSNPTSDTKDTPSISDIKTQQERLSIKLGIKLGVITFLNDNLGEKLGIIEEEGNKLLCKLGDYHSVKLGESWEKVGRKPIIPSVSSIFFTQDYRSRYG